MRYDIKGDTLPVVIINLESGESIITQGGGMAWMSPNMHMETTSRGGIGKLLGRALAGDTLFQNIYTAENGNGVIAVASSFPGEIRKFEITPEKPIILQKSAFLCSDRGVELSVFFKKNLGTGLFGGEGFIMQKITGNGMVFLEIDGHCKIYELGVGESIIVDTGYLAAMSESCTMDIETVQGVKNIFFGGEGLFHTRITGPGKVYIQSMPLINMAEAITPYLNINTGDNNGGGGINIRLGE